MNTDTIKSVTRNKLTNGGFRFVDQDGNVLRAKATRPYNFAAIHARPIVSKFTTLEEVTPETEDECAVYKRVSEDARAYVTFHGTAKIAPAHSLDTIERVIEIKEAA